MLTARSRHAALEAATAALSAAGGWVEDVHDFAGHAITLVAGLPEARLDELVATLAVSGLGASVGPWEPLGGDRVVSLRLVFAAPDEGARRAVPPIPG